MHHNDCRELKVDVYVIICDSVGTVFLNTMNFRHFLQHKTGLMLPELQTGVLRHITFQLLPYLHLSIRSTEYSMNKGEYLHFPG